MTPPVGATEAEKRDLQAACKDALAKINDLRWDAHQERDRLELAQIARPLVPEEQASLSRLQVADAILTIAAADLRVGAAASIMTSAEAASLVSRLETAKDRLEKDLKALAALAKRLEDLASVIDKIGIVIDKAGKLAAKFV